MSRISIRRPHKLGHAELRSRVSHLAERLSEKYGADCTWDGDVVHIDHSNVTGTVTVSKSEIVIDAKLGFFLGMFSHRVEEEITKILDEELGRKI
ncbi:MAG: polyhydroxyalkanoic acid system family protein [Steroidobacteraceae bacterium]|jgi:putative polyhydroxyalkanoate system protein|nr:polyhydroxyalkanoic acid system family protein [Steroidobacteraceae bacterium]